MVRETHTIKAVAARPGGVWKECPTKEEDSSDIAALKAAAAAPASAPVATAGRSNPNGSRRKKEKVPSSESIATGGNGGSANKAGVVGATADGWLEAPFAPAGRAMPAAVAAPPPPSSAAPAVGRPLSASSMVPTTAVAAMQHAQDPAHSGEVFLMEMLAAMDQHMQQLRETQQGLVATVELACRRALGRNFTRLVLVGSVALRVETPGSDVDVVCFTRRDGAEAADGNYDACGLPVDVLRRVHWALTVLVSQYADNGANFSMELIDDARVPILRVLWGSSIAVDVSVDQSRPVDHVRWFQRVGAAPRPTAPPPAVAPLVTLTLRCVKWWLRQRQVPRTKEGGLPTLAWLLMAVHVCSLPETHEQAIISGQRPMVALLASLAAFFHHYAAIEGLDGVLVFAADGSSSEFRRRDLSDKCLKANPSLPSSPWGELSVLDPTREGVESLDLAPRVPPATQLMLHHELRRASQRLHRVPKGRELSFGDGRRVLEEVFEPLQEGVNALPSFIAPNMGVMGALLLWGQDNEGVGTVELAIIDSISPRPGWTAPFLHRSDERSELSARLLDIEERSGRAVLRKTNIPEVSLCPCHFICRVQLEKDGRGANGGWRMDNESLERFKAMKWCLTERAAHASARLLTQQTTAAKTAPVEVPTATSPEHMAKLPSPARASRTP